jgi:DNA polymerase-3 subunit delta'
MTQQAQNALLKTLEEPPSDSVLILIAENINAIFETILSRTKKVRFFSLPAGEVGKILEERYEIEKDKAGLLASISSGELGKAVKFNSEDFFAKRNRIINSLKSTATSDSDFDGFSKPDLKIALDVMLTWYRDVLVAKTGGDCRELLINIDKLDLIYDEAGKSTFDELNKIINQVILTSSFLDQNVNTKLAMGVLGVNLARR